MKTKLLLLCFLAYVVKAQKPQIHLVIAADIEDNAYAVRNFSKEQKLKSMYDLISKKMSYGLKIQYLHTTENGFSAKGVLDSLSKVKILTKDDILIFYYLGRGYYPNLQSKIPQLEFRDNKKMLSFEQVRKKITPLKTRLSLIIADCDESISLAKPSVLPSSLINTSFKDMENKVQYLYASSDNMIEDMLDDAEFSIISHLQNQEDSLYRQECLSKLEILRLETLQKRLGVKRLWHISKLVEFISSYKPEKYPTPFNRSQDELLEKLLNLPNVPFRVEPILNYHFKLLVDALFIKREILDFEDPINVKLEEFADEGSRILVHESWRSIDYEWIKYYFETIGTLKAKLGINQNLKGQISGNGRNGLIVSRLEKYTNEGMPLYDLNNTDRELKRLNELPKVTNQNYKTTDFGIRDLDYLIDAIFRKKKILVEGDSLILKLDSLIEYSNRPLIKPIEFLTQAELDNYFENLVLLEQFLSSTQQNLGNQKLIEKVKRIYQRINNYKRLGFPEKGLVLFKDLSKTTDENVAQITDVLYNNNQLLNFSHPLFVKLDSIIDGTLTIHTKNLNPSDWQYYTSSLKKLENLQKVDVQDSVTLNLIRIALKNVQNYPKNGFPKTNFDYDLAIKQLSSQIYYYIKPESKQSARDRAYGVIIDSLYLTKRLFNFEDTLYTLLKSLIKSQLPDMKTYEGTLTTVESLEEPIIKQIFLSECGIIEIASGHKKKLETNNYVGDYTDKVRENLNELLNKTILPQINELSLSSLFIPMKAPFIYNYKNTVKTTCKPVGADSEFFLPDFKKIPTEEKVNKLFLGYVKANDLPKKKAIKKEITDFFEPSAVLKVKPIIPTSSSTSKPLVSININDYFLKLDTQQPKVDSVGVREGTLRRNKNFSKIATLLIIEN